VWLLDNHVQSERELISRSAFRVSKSLQSIKTAVLCLERECEWKRVEVELNYQLRFYEAVKGE